MQNTQKKKENKIFDIYEKIVFKLKTFIKKFKILDKIAVTLLYVYALSVQLYTTRISMGEFPFFFYVLFPFIPKILNSKLVRLLAVPEKTYFIYIFLSEIIIYNKSLKLPILVKFNALYIFTLELLQNLFISIADLLYINEFTGIAMKKKMKEAHWNIYFSFFLLYLYSYFWAMLGTFPKFNRAFILLQKVVDSVAFWLRIKRVSKADEKKYNIKN